MDIERRVQVVEDIEAIRKLKAAYCAACDDDHNPEKLGPLFTEDATWEANVMGRAEGRAAIQEHLGAVGRSGRMARTSHNVFNPVIDVSGDRATGAWRLLMLYTENLPGGKFRYQRIIGRYDDRYERIRGKCLIASLHCTVEESGPYEAQDTLAPELR